MLRAMILPFDSALPDIAWPAAVSGRGMATLSLLFQLERTQWWPADRLRDAQQAQLKRLLSHAARHVPFYRRRLGKLADADGEAFWQGWRELPLLTRQDVQQAGDDLVSRALPDGHGELTEVYTSGSTGKPIHAVRSDLWLLMWSAVTVREHLWHGRDVAGKLAAIRESTAGKALYPDGEHLENWGFSTADIFRTGPCVSLNITTPVDDQLEWLVREAPDYLLTHPTMLDRLIRRSTETGLRPRKLRQVLTISEILAPGLRELCRAEWNAPVVDTYSTREAGYLALQCPDTDHYHLQSETALVEILDPAGRPCAPGDIGRVIVTPLHNLAMPLVRYDIGDHAEVGAPCSVRPRPAGDPPHPGPPTEHAAHGRGRALAALVVGRHRQAFGAGADPAIPVRADPSRPHRGAPAGDADAHRRGGAGRRRLGPGQVRPGIPHRPRLPGRAFAHHIG